jgi:hypothetical protein
MLQYFLEFGRIVQDACQAKIFQSLFFVVRDWKFPQKYDFGFEGGNELLNQWFGVRLLCGVYVIIIARIRSLPDEFSQNWFCPMQN